MPITIHCPHDKAELELIPDKKSPDGLIRCPKCGCTYRVCLAIFDKKCFIKQYPKLMGAESKPKKEIILDETGVVKSPQTEWVGGPMQNIPEKRKRRRLPKNHLKIKITLEGHENLRTKLPRNRKRW